MAFTVINVLKVLERHGRLAARQCVRLRVCMSTDSHHFIEPYVEDHTLCRATENNPMHHERRHEGLFYCVCPEHKKYFVKGNRPQFVRASKAFTEMGVMVRRPATEIFECLDAVNYNLPVVRFGLYGPSGAGKSITLSHVMDRCAQDGWLIVHHPFLARFWRTPQSMTPSTANPKLTDTGPNAAAWMKYFAELNKARIQENKIVTNQQYQWSKKDIIEEGSSIVKLIQFAQEKEKYACEILGILLQEIKENAKNKNVKVLAALDGVNGLFEGKTKIHMPDDYSKFMIAEDFSTVRHFQELLKNDWNNGAIVCTIDQDACSPPKDTCKPVEILGQRGFDAMDPFIPIEVPNFSNKEAHSFLEYLADRRFLRHPYALSEEGRKEFFFLSEMNPRALYQCTLRY